MEIVIGRCCGLDVHQKTVVACVLITEATGHVTRHQRTFGTMTRDLEELSAWLQHLGVEQVAMESTGVYWWPVFNVLEAAGHALLVANPAHMKAVPGRKTDVADSVWIADLARHGLVRASFIPPAAIRHLRELTRYRTSLVQQRTQEVNRLHKVLESANIKLAVVASDILGASGHLMLVGLLASEEPDPAALAALAKGRLRRKLEELQAALDGRVQSHHRVLLRRMLALIGCLNESIAVVHDEIAAAARPCAATVALLQTIPGIQTTAALSVLAEIGEDMGRFVSAKHVASWAGVCPGNRQSGGKRLKGTTTHGNVWLRGILGEIAWAAIHDKDTYFAAQYQRLVRRLGPQKAVVAVMHSLLVVIYCVLRDQRPYTELGADYFATRDPDRLLRQHVHRLEQLGYTVTLTPQNAA